MATETSQQVMALLKELSILKEIDTKLEVDSAESHPEEHQLRQQRKQEILQQIKTLAEQKKNADEISS
ncbi:MAG TPA: hypothetical protein VL983_08960 [Terriglobales bacterium]|nr:hypothetical protein [Terriglobales bacterium]